LTMSHHYEEKKQVLLFITRLVLYLSIINKIIVVLSLNLYQNIYRIL
jgi:hypothetical protein